MGFILLLLLAVAGFAGLSMLMSRDELKQFDLSIIQTVQGWENGTLTAIAKFLSHAGSSAVTIPLVIVTAIVLFIVLKHRKELVLLIGAMLGSTLLNELVKHLYRRARPDIHRIVTEQGFSYPSGHSMAALTFYGILTYLLWRHLPNRGWRIALLTFSIAIIAAIGLSRIYLGAHYPSDIIGGYWLSGCWVALCIGLFRKLNKKPEPAASR